MKERVTLWTHVSVDVTQSSDSLRCIFKFFIVSVITVVLSVSRCMALSQQHPHIMKHHDGSYLDPFIRS